MPTAPTAAKGLNVRLRKKPAWKLSHKELCTPVFHGRARPGWHERFDTKRPWHHDNILVFGVCWDVGSGSPVWRHVSRLTLFCPGFFLLLLLRVILSRIIQQEFASQGNVTLQLFALFIGAREQGPEHLELPKKRRACPFPLGDACLAVVELPGEILCRGLPFLLPFLELSYAKHGLLGF